MNFDEMKNKVRDAAKEHGDKVREGMDKVADAAKSKLGHEDQIDKVTDKAKEQMSGGE